MHFAVTAFTRHLPDITYNSPGFNVAMCVKQT